MRRRWVRACADPYPIKHRPGRHIRGAPAVEGGEGAAFTGEDMGPANLSRFDVSLAPGGGNLSGADQALRVRDELLDPRANHTGLLTQVLAG